ncbi:ATP-dependent transcriptional regulator, MalT-like, LuxR family [Pseudonocardia dioxanivorans CB1190]|uniref:ATP-dependent transcriptional regulator, MalT-like, LuxR family n=1 Tax=Pseudonocardia dioxanivorans (strain ATCC 55486 / DSM 44775 / JCM 13855 / CB1190) TaxID=675635 RepID=F4CYY1_PSEUX|nr:LuxR family transcriptional regulator [Pseudonocardia dioxanivorans]AEA27706.1 ATP-dependent transcriptional regulator, MalT-like, LuxR family [Pseudonocardia dioxanivorans CB1190]
MQLPDRAATSRRAPDLAGRRIECQTLDRLVRMVRAGGSRALVLHGDAGVGKTALLEYLAGNAAGCRVARAAGVESEMELAFAGLHQLCAPMLERLEVLPAPQGDALRAALGMTVGSTPDRFLVGLAVLSMLSDVAEEQPLVCLVDDQQWLDQASAQVLGFVARRLGAEAVGLVFAARVRGTHLEGLPELMVRGLPRAEARALLDSVLTGPIDDRVRDQIVAETRGNLLALLELPRGFTVAELAGGFGLPVTSPLAGSIEESFRRRVGALPHETRRLLLLAAADPTGDPALVWRASGRLGIGADAAAAAADADLADFGTRVRFRHPLARAAAYWSAPAHDRHEAHRALAEATDAQLDPDRRAWHRAHAAPGPDEDVAAELERSAGRAQARGGLGAAAAFLKYAATLTLDPARRAERALAAAHAKIQAGAFDAAVDLLAIAEAGPLSDLDHARADMLRAQVAYVGNRGSDAAPLLVKAAERLALIDADLSRAAHLDALAAAIFAGRLAGPGGDVTTVARAAASAPPPQRAARAPDLLLDGLAADYNQGYAAELPLLRTALATFGADMSTEEELHWLSWASVTAMRTWDDEHWDALSARHVRLARTTGTLSELPLALTLRTYLLLFVGDLAAASSLVDEAHTVKDVTGSNLAPYGALGLAAFHGDEARAAALLDATMQDVNRRGEGLGITLAEWSNTVLHNGLGRYDAALAAARRATAYEPDLGSMAWPAVEIVEAAVRAGAVDTATGACRRLSEMTGASGTQWALGLHARSRALLSEGDEAERHYREAIARLGRTRVRTDLARAHLLYGEWLRRERRRGDAREQLRTAHTMLEAMGLAAFAERAGRELRATGATARKRTLTDSPGELTAQEAQIARLARDGLSNPEIGTRLFLSAHTVQYHLRKVFTKLGITSRGDLDRVLATDAATTAKPEQS